jgi:hypothetical protein
MRAAETGHVDINYVEKLTLDSCLISLGETLQVNVSGGSTDTAIHQQITLRTPCRDGFKCYQIKFESPSHCGVSSDIMMEM